jgi:hypothetical protein
MSKFEYSKELPDEIKQDVEKRLSKLEYLIPQWCSKVMVFWDDTEDSDTTIYAKTYYDYRYNSITICPAYLSQTEKTRTEALRHDLVHGITGIFNVYVQDVIKRILKEDKDKTLRELIIEEIKERNEAITQDFTLILEKLELKKKI